MARDRTRLTAPRQLTTADAWTRYQRNGYDWDMHGTLIHAGERNRSASGFRFFSRRRGQRKDHGSDARRQTRIGARAGGPRIQSAGAHLSGPLPARRRMATTDRRSAIRSISRIAICRQDEISDRNLKCTFNVILQGAGLLTDEHFAGREIIGFGHSTGGPMAAHLTRFSKKTKVIGIVGFGSGGPDGWRLEWRNKTGAEKYTEKPIDHVSRRSPDSFKESGYIDPEDLNAMGWRRRLHSSRQPAALADENESLRQSAQCRHRHSRRISQAHRACRAKNISITCRNPIRTG